MVNLGANLVPPQLLCKSDHTMWHKSVIIIAKPIRHLHTVRSYFVVLYPDKGHYMNMKGFYVGAALSFAKFLYSCCAYLCNVSFIISGTTIANMNVIRRFQSKAHRQLHVCEQSENQQRFQHFHVQEVISQETPQ